MGKKVKAKVKPQKTSKATSTNQKKRPAKWKYASVEQELQAVGLRVKEMTADGNCFFRAVADQLGGDDHLDIRAQVVAFIQQNAEQFAPFIEDDEGFEPYVKRMSREGVWAGHLELQACSLCFSTNIVIFQQGQPCWRIINWTPTEEHECLYLSYHDGEHYNSVRLAGDSGSGKPARIDLSALEVDPSKVSTDNTFGEREVRQVCENTYCFDQERAKAALVRAKGDVDAAIEWLIEDLAADDSHAAAASEPSQTTELAQIDTQQAVDPSVALPETGSADVAAIAHGTDPSNPRDEQNGVRGDDSAAAVPMSHAVSASEDLASASMRAQGRGSSCGLDAPCVQVAETTEGNVELAEPSGEGMAADGGEERGAGAKDRADAPVGVCEALNKSTKAPKRPQNNKPCPCGSTRKYKNCCKVADLARARLRQADQASDESRAALVIKQLESIDI